MRQISPRQVHLDFHTSEHMPGVGSKFDKKQFQEALIEGHVNSITIFGKCHHGYFYYPTKVGTVHPTMEPGKDLAGEMMEQVIADIVDALQFYSQAIVSHSLLWYKGGMTRSVEDYSSFIIACMPEMLRRYLL